MLAGDVGSVIAHSRSRSMRRSSSHPFWTSKMPNDNAPLIIVTPPGVEPESQIDLDDEHLRTLFCGNSHEGCSLDVGAEALRLVRGLQARLNTDLERIERLHDDRLLVLVAAMFVENAVGDVLKSLLPGYDELEGKRDFTFSMKISVLRALAVVPFKILNNADFIRKMRNSFAHNVAVERFCDLEPSVLRSLRDRAEKYNSLLGDYEQDADVFRDFAYCTISGLYVFQLEASVLNDFMRSPEHLNRAVQEFLDERSASSGGRQGGKERR